MKTAKLLNTAGRLLIIAGAIFAFSATAFAADLTYDPASINLSAPAGSVQTMPLKVTLHNAGWSVHYLWFVDKVTGNLPLTVSSSRQMTFLGSWSPSASTMLTLTVAPGTPPGTYTGNIFSKAMSSHGYADAGTGVLVELIVPSACNGVPSFTINSFGPDYLWPPNHSMVEVTVTGQAVLPQGCNILSAGYSIDDEYGIYTGMGSLTIDQNGYFVKSIPVEAWRTGQDKDGRHYTITLFAEDEAGVGTHVLHVLVPHDMRNKNKNK